MDLIAMFLEIIGLNKDLLRRFADYFIQKAVGDELKILFDLFESFKRTNSANVLPSTRER